MGGCSLHSVLCCLLKVCFPYCLLQNILQGRERKGIGRKDQSEPDWYLEPTISGESEENESLSLI